jgi:NAD(P)-dependent dehydrogenase (short-subunit alcohol dehydrogenase family)
MTFNFEDKVVLVTGGTRGIGKAISLAFGQAKAKVIMVYYSNEVEAQKTQVEMRNMHQHSIRCDVSKPEEVRKMVKDIALKYGQIDILINNAGVYIPHEIDKIPYNEWQYKWTKTIDVNLNAPANICFCVANYMLLQGSGKIINITSRGAYRGEPDHPAYGAAKAGLNSLTQSLAKKLAPKNIFVAALAPGFVETDMAYPYLHGDKAKEILAQSPLNRAADPDEIAKAVLFLASEGIGYMTGSIVDMNGASYFR